MASKLKSQTVLLDTFGLERGEKFLPQSSAVSGGNKGENTWNADLKDLLRATFPSSDFELLFPTLKGIRKPDVCFQGPHGVVLVSGKHGASKEVDAIASAQEYQQVIGEVGTIQDVFSLTYPLKKNEAFHLRVLATKNHTSLSWSLSALDKVAEKIVEVTNGDFDRAHRDKESSVTSTIRVLRKGVADFSACLSETPLEDMEQIFGGKEFFESVTGFEGALSSREDVLRRAAAYLFLNQVLFYEILAKETGQYRIIDPLDYTKPQVLKIKYFNEVLKKDYRPIFSFDVVSHIRGAKVADSSKMIILSAKALFSGSESHDVLGKIFHELIPLDLRKTVAAYYTNAYAGDLLARLTITDPESTVLDPACGSGTLLVSSYKQKLALHGGKNNSSLHKDFVERELTGVDIMPFSAHLAAVHLALQAPLYETDNIRIAIEDSTKLVPGTIIETARKTLKDTFKGQRLDDYGDTTHTNGNENKETTRGGVTLGEPNEDFTIDKVDIVIMNPPFTSNDNLPANYKKTLKTRFSYVAYQKCLTGKLSFQAYFILLADKFLKNNGKLACVIPLTTFTGKAFANLIEFILSRYTIQYIVVGSGRSAFSEDTSLSEILLIAEKKVPAEDSEFVLMGTKTSPASWDSSVVDLLFESATLSKCNSISIENDSCVTRICKQRNLAQRNTSLSMLVTNLEKQLKRTQDLLLNIFEGNEKITTLSELCTQNDLDIFAYELANPDKETQIVHQRGGKYFGISALAIHRSEDRAIKNVDRLVKINQNKDAITVIDRISKQTFDIPLTEIVPCSRRLSGETKIDCSYSSDFIIKRYYPGVADLLNVIYDQEVIPILSRRIQSEWASKVERGSSVLCLARRIDLSAKGTHLLATYSDTPMFLMANSWGIRNICADDAKIMVLWFNSTLFLASLVSVRSKTRGSWGQIDAGQLNTLPFINITKLTPDERKILLDLFNFVNKTDMPSICEQLNQKSTVKVAIDSAFLTILGMKDRSKQDNLIKQMYQSLGSHLEKNKKTMAED